MQRIGDILVEQGAIARDELEQFAQKATDRIGTSLRAHARIGGRDLARALAQQLHLPYVELEHGDVSLYRTRDLKHYITYRYAPYRFKNGVLTVATSEPSRLLNEEVARHHGCPVMLVVTSGRDLSAYYAKTGASALTRRARLNLRRQHKTLVADKTLVPHQARGFIALGALLLSALVFQITVAWNILLVACNLFYLVSLAFKIVLYIEGKSALRASQTLRQQLLSDIAALDEKRLPVYTILVPFYRESPEVMSRLIRNLNALDYPKEKLDIKLICEADDAATIDGLKALHPPETMEIIAVPPSNPRTKPKACNVALQQMRGEYAVIFDAEDAPEPEQLKLSIALFQRDGKQDLACLQAPLNYYNRSENILTRLFAIEYSALFKLLLPALERMKLPIPLGGTSNHLRVSALQEAGGWDAFNVTEDADLGVRLSYLGYRTRILPSITMEEAPIRFLPWLRQRTRWIKGYIQTWLVYMRNPVQLKQRLGDHAYYGFQFFIGAPALTFLLAPIFWGIFILSLAGFIPVQMSGWILGLCMVSLFGGIISQWIYARAVVSLEDWRDMGTATLIFPFYWILHSLACFRALWQLAFSPHYWDKTTHGISKVFSSNTVDSQPPAR